MGLRTVDQYYLKALDNYPFDLEAVAENLNYALSYDPDHGPANCLMGRTYMEHVKDYAKAAEFFDKAIIGDMDFPDTYKFYSLLKSWQNDYSGAMKIIDYGMKVKGIDKVFLIHIKSIIYESQGAYTKAEIQIQNALKFSFEKNRNEFFKNELSRIKKKIKVNSKEKSKKNKKNKKLKNKKKHLKSNSFKGNSNTKFTSVFKFLKIMFYYANRLRRYSFPLFY